eukprot:TRINITY_DN100632_c0_g1_i1.p1 TRINITY_DN100632_c0_g1~~TRINITY_DN100632_c0_g1_i1.p1  ORF type:complete len:755 (-),score=230.45 TRINITY_DN100632_c0_g1_i1:35-2299(-)
MPPPAGGGYPGGGDGGAGVGGRSELLNVLGEVKARVQDKLGIVGFPMPQFILIGKQSVGKSRLIEALAGEQFNFISGTLGSRRPTVLEFRNVTASQSKWYMRDRNTESKQWRELPIEQVMVEVGKAHEELGETVSIDPIYVRVESPYCVDMQIVDLPGFRDFAMDAGKKDLQGQIESLVKRFMNDKNNVMLCVEQAGDASTMSTLQKCREIDPKFERTILIRNKLDKYYDDLTNGNINQWVQGFGDLPEDLNHPVRFALTLPFWKDGQPPPEPFVTLRQKMNKKDVETMKTKGLAERYQQYIGFDNFAKYMEQKIEQLFSDAIGPVLAKLENLRDSNKKDKESLVVEFEETDPQRILSTTRDVGISFATALSFVMEGVLDLEPTWNLEEELSQFHKHHESLGSNHFCMLPILDFSGLADYITYLREESKVATFDVEVNGGAQFRRLMNEVEIFLRFSEIAVEIKKKDVIQARGVSMSSLTWRDVVVKLLNNEAHLPLQRRVAYVAERIKWFFEMQKEPVVNFMDSLEGTPAANIYSPLFPRHAKLLKSNPIIKHLVYRTYDEACARNLKQFIDLFDNMLTSTFSNPWVFLKGATSGGDDGVEEDLEDAVLPSFDDTKDRIVTEIGSRSGNETRVSGWLQDIPTASQDIDDAVDKVQMLVLKTYGFIRSQVCDQVELFAESFFKLPMLRRLEEDMANMDLDDQDKKKYKDRREKLTDLVGKADENLSDVDDCIAKLQAFKLKQDSRLAIGKIAGA